MQSLEPVCKVVKLPFLKPEKKILSDNENVTITVFESDFVPASAVEIFKSYTAFN